MQPRKTGQVFEITDHTTATDWERFIADLEEILVHNRKETRVSGSEKWFKETEDIKFGNFTFELTYRWFDGASNSKDDFENCLDENGEALLPPLAYDLIDTTNDFVSKAHCLYRWYNLKQFIILIPKDDYIITEDRTKIIISSASIASSNVGSQIPIFVQIHHPRVSFYQGISEHPNMRVMFEMAYFKQGCKQYRYLSESINLFREKVGCTLSDPISATIRLNYCFESFKALAGGSSQTTRDITQNDQSRVDSGRRSIFGEFPSSTSVERLISRAQMLSSSAPTEPKFDLDFVEAVNCLMRCKSDGNVLRYLHVGALWPPISDKIISDTPVHSDLNPFEAPIWTMRAITQDPHSVSMAAIIFTLLEISCRHQSSKSMLESNYEDWTNEIALVFEKFQSKILTSIMSFIFQDDDQEFVKPIKYHRETNWLKSCKAAPSGSLLHRIAISLAITSVYSDLTTLSRIWKAILCELRRYYEHSLMLPDLDDNPSADVKDALKPDHGSCLLQQKLQMLNCCIRQKLRTKNILKVEQSEQEPTLDGDEEFYDCETAEELPEIKSQPIGRLEPLEDLCLLDSKERLYIPVTQDIAPLTEDALQEYTAAMTKLARESQDEMSLKMYQSAGLVSDMSAFKAANPGCRFEDFVRWFSPKDWVLDSDKNGKPLGERSSSKSGRLTHRMLLPGSLWYELWDAAKPMPVTKQKLLFDHRKEAEKVFEYLSSMTVKELLDNIIPTLLVTSCSQLNAKLNILLDQQEEERVETPTPETKQIESSWLKPSDLIELLEARNYQGVYSTLAMKELQIHLMDGLNSVFEFIINYVIKNLHANDEFEKSIDEIRSNCRQLSYQLSTNPEVVVSRNTSDDIRKLLVVLFHLQNESRRAHQESEMDTTVEPGFNRPHDLSQDDCPIGRLLRTFGRDNRPTVKEFIIRCEKHRPYESGLTPALPQRLFCTITDDDFRLCGAFSEICG